MSQTILATEWTIGYRGSIPGRENCCFSYPKRQARPWNQTILHIQWIQGACSPEVRGPYVETDHSLLRVPKLRMSGATPQLVHIPP